MLKEVIKLKEHGVFDVVAESPTRDVVEEMPVQQIIVGQETMLVRAWDRLMDDGIHIMGLYGMGGVGKTTLLEQINNNFRGANGGFDVVIWVVVSKEKQVEKIQDDIAEKLGLSGGGWNQKTRSQKATNIHGSMRNKRFVLLLDDIWSKVDLKEIGVPFPNRENKCKIAFTTRSREVCGRMGVDDPMEVKCLAPYEAWELFQNKVGRNTLESHPDILDLACKVVEKCRGLPLAVNVIGETMACKRTVQEWHNAIDVLSSSAAEFSGMEEEVLSILKYSYDSFKGEHVKSCFLYCALFPEDFLIEKDRSIDYWICEGFIDEMQGIEKAVNQGYEIIGTLVRACLLLEEGKRSHVKMHDVIREMALWIASDLGKYKESCIVQAEVGLGELPKLKNWNSVRRMSLIRNHIKKISESPDCPELVTLLLRGNTYLANISGEFFRSMPRLLVLDMSENYRLRGLPEEISKLVSLRYLDLSDTVIEVLPIGLQELKMLIHLNLESTSLENLDGISNLSSLRTLRLLHSKVWLDMRLMKELQLLEHLEFISINISSSLVEKLLVYDPRVGRCIQHVAIEEDSEESVRVLVLPAMDTLCEISIHSCGMGEIKIEKTPWNKNLTSPCFSSLSDLKIEICDGLKDLTWLLFAPNLIELTRGCLMQVEEVISKEKAENETFNNIIPFQKLEVLTLSELPVLKNIYWNALPFQRLRELHVYGNCQKLRKLPLDSKSVFKVDEFVIKCSKSYEEWIQGIEWEDEATQARFLPLCKLD